MEQCLLSVAAATKHIEAEIFVVDNNSNDESIVYLQPKFNWVQFIASNTNLGFAKANNVALKKATGDYVLFLNPDTIISEGCLLRTMAFLKQNNQSGATGIYMIDGTGNYLPESKRAFPSPLISLFKLFGLAQLFPKSKKFAKYYLGHLKTNSNNEIDVLSGAFILLKKEVAQKTMGFDENFFMYGEDIDLSYRIQQLGYKNYCFVDTPIIHFKGESTKKNNVFYLKTFYKAMDQFVHKHYKNKRSGLFASFLKFGIWLRAIIAFGINFLKLVTPIIVDAASLSLSVIGTRYFSEFVYQTNVNIETLLKSSLLFFGVYTLLNFINNKYLKAINLQKLLLNMLVAFIAVAIYSLVFLKSWVNVFIWIQIVFVFFVSRYLVSVRLIKMELFPTYANNPMHEQMFIVGSITDFKKVNNILEANKLNQLITGRVAVNDAENYLSVGHVNKLALLVKNYPVKEIIFVASDALPYSLIIQLIETLPRNMQFYFYHSNAGAIISSYSKNLSGQVIIA